MDDIVNKRSHGKKLCDSIFQFYQPIGPVQLEVVFVHGLEYDNCGDAYWNTWLARDGTLDNVWPMTWLPDEFSSAKVFALKYDASIKQTDTNGRMDLFVVGEMLIQEMVGFGQIGQNGVLVVFVCHGFGGLVAKQIVVNAKHNFSQDPKAQKLLKNIGAILFYSTPHHGSHLANSSSYFYRFWGGGKGPLLENLEVLSANISRLNQAFEQAAEEHSWIFVSAAETHETKPYGKMAEEHSLRFERGNYLALSKNHFDVVRPKTKEDSSYLLLTSCLEKVLDKYKVKLTSKVENLIPDSFVRLEIQEEAIMRKLQEVSIVGLVGMGGIGKTTLAKGVYQSICKNFDKSCYLDDVKSKTSLDEVLITLLQNIGIKDIKTGCIVERSALQDCKRSLLDDLKTCVQQQRVLVVIDDVGTKENFDCLLKDMDFLNGNKESKVIVTCRNWQVLKDYVHECGRYEVEPMSSGQDTILFAYHAFKGARTLQQRHQILLGFLSKDSSEHLINEFESKCNDVVKACRGLPLSLEVMGCCLGGYLADGKLSSMECLDCWRGALKKLERAEPLEGGIDNDRLWKVLQISYDCLHKNEQNMFLDIACFFCNSVRYGEQTLLRIWGGKPEKLVEFKNLKERCLVKIKEEDESVTMHDQLRDMGRGIVRHQSKEVLNKMTRLWAFENVNKLLHNKEITTPSIQGLSMEEWGVTPMEGNSVGTSKQLKIGKLEGFSLNCPALRLLNLHKVEEKIVEGISIKGLSCIQWLCLKGINISELPKFVQVCNELCVLDMRDCRNLKNLDGFIENLVNLLELNLSKCTSLVTLPNSLGDMVNLTKLDFSGCSRLTSLPNSIGKLVNLSRLSISDCIGLSSLPDSIGKLLKLLKLDISSCEGLTSLPYSIGKLVKLLKLDISGCKRLTSLPDSIGKLVNLSTLDISGCEGLSSLPDSIGELLKLLKLDISSCEGLTNLPYSIGQLVKLLKLDIFRCKGLTSLPDSIGMLVNLSTLDIYGCKGLTSLPESIGKLVKLLKLDISGCEGLTNLPNSIDMLVNLSELYLSNCEGLTSLPNSIGMLVNLSELYLSNCEQLISLPNSIGKMVKLVKLDISGCKGLTSLPNSIGKMVKLVKFDISGCKGLTSLENSIGEFDNLSRLYLLNCEQLISLPDSIGMLINLSILDMYGCKRLTCLPDSIGMLVKLLKLDISGCKGLTSLPDSIGKFVNLLELYIRNCDRLTSLPDSIKMLVNLSILNISGCKELTSLPNSIGKLFNLVALDISGCKGLISLPDSIGWLVNLSTLDISGCKGLTSVPDSIGKFAKLSTLDLYGCEGLTNLPRTLGDLSHLDCLIVSHCRELVNIPQSIGRLSQLVALKLYNLVNLESLPETLGDLVQLKILAVNGCSNLVELPQSTSRLLQLSCLNLRGCSRWKWMKTSNISLLHKLQQHGCFEIQLPNGRLYHGKYSTGYCSSGMAGCDGCDLEAISTKCWHCDMCPQFDLCESCYERRNVLQLPQEHNSDHQLTAIEVL